MVTSCFLYCLYTSDLPEALRSKCFVYVALAAQAKKCEGVEKAIRTDFRKLAIYFTNWRLKPNVGKTVSCLFHLDRELNTDVAFCVMKIKNLLMFLEDF